MGAILVYLTAEHKQQAETIARALLEERLIACANIIDGATSLYRWQGRIQESRECLIIAKSQSGHLEKLNQTVRRLHSYEVPCVAALPITGGNEAFLEWIIRETS